MFEFIQIIAIIIAIIIISYLVITGSIIIYKWYKNNMTAQLINANIVLMLALINAAAQCILLAIVPVCVPTIGMWYLLPFFTCIFPISLYALMHASNYLHALIEKHKSILL